MLKVRIADTSYTQERGLSFIDSMPDDEGMLFVFKRPNVLNFWGKDTYIPLDIAFVDSSHTIIKIAKIKSMSFDCVSSDKKCTMAIEANEGYFERNGIEVGDKISIDATARKKVGTFYSQPEAGVGYIDFLRTQKELRDDRSNVKTSQIMAPDVQKVDKKEDSPIGMPIGNDVKGQEGQVDAKDLPVLNISDLGGKLEDELDQPEESTQENPPPEQPEETGLPPQEEQLPQEQQAPPVEEYPVFSNVFDAAKWAQNNNEVVRIDYTTRHGRRLVRDVEPHGQFHSESTHRQILVTFDETIGDIRAFIMTNIGGWSFVGRQFNKKFIVKG